MRRTGVWCLMALILLPLPAKAQVLVIRDDRWASESPQAQFLVNSQVRTAERWLRRVRLPYQRVNATALTNGQASGSLCLLPANRPDPPLIAKLQRAWRVVVWAFVGGQEATWQRAIGRSNGVIQRNGWRLITQPFDPQLPDGKRAQQVAAWLLEGTTLPLSMRKALRERWTAWRQNLTLKRQAWLQEIAQRSFADRQRRQKALQLLRPPVAVLPLTLTANGTAWLQRLRTLLSEHERIHKALAVSLEPREGEIRGVWLHTSAPTDWESVMQTLKAANFNCLFFRAGRGGNVVYKSRFLPRDEWAEQADLDELQKATEAAKRYGIELHAWRVNFHFGTAPDWLKEQMAKEDRLVRDPQGKQALWLNPGDPRNQQHELAAMLELLNYPVMGVHFDYIRYPEVPHYNFDYGQVSQREFEKATGIKLTDFPRQVLFGPLKIRYDDWQRENITGLVRRVYYAVKDVNPQVAVSAAVWQRHRYYFALIKQDWMRWVREGILDFVCPMDYNANNETFTERVREQVMEVNGQIPIAPGIGAYLLDDEWQFVEQVKIIRDLGADGFVMFSYNIAPLKEFLSALALGATARPTNPAHRAPHITFHLSKGVWLKDMPIVYHAGDTVRIAAVVSLGLLPSDGVKEMRLALGWERKEGFPQKVLMERALSVNELSKGITVRCTAKVPKGTMRLVAKGIVRFADGTSQPFVRRGPFVKGVSRHELTAMMQALLPFRPPPRAPRPIVGIVAEGWNAERFAKLFRRLGMTVFFVRVLEPAYWQASDILVMPPLKDLQELTEQRAEALRRWVEKGGRLLLLSEACGYRAHPNLFPEVATVTGEQGITLLRNRHQTLPVNARALLLQPINGTVRWRANGNAVAVQGKVGKGSVVMVGMQVPTQDDETAWQGWKQLLSSLAKLLRHR